MDALIKRTYVYKSLYDEQNYPSFFPANIAFLYNFSTQNADNYYRLDNIDSGNKIPEPPVPERAGYYFIGWYIEHECINAWDFNTVPAIEENTELRLYAKWQEE